MCRAVIIHFPYKPPLISLDVLDETLKNASAAFLQLLRIDKVILDMSPQRFYDVSERISAASNLDQRLAMQYALSMVVVEEVGVYIAILCICNAALCLQICIPTLTLDRS